MKIIRNASHYTWMLMAIMGLCLWQNPVHAQDGVSNAIYDRGYTQIENTLPPSPGAASAVKYADVTFNPGTGMASFQVPVYELQGRHLRIPVSLCYQSGGVKVDEIPGVAGLGWALEAGGVLTRDIVYMPDEYSNWGFYEWPSEELMENMNAPGYINETMAFLKRVLWRQKDTQADRYSYNVCGLHGTFILTPEREVEHLTGDGVLVKLNASDLTFTLIGPDGTQYCMTAIESGTRINMPVDPSPMTGLPESWTAPTAWHLTQMISADGTETASFSYESAGTWNRNERTRSWSWNYTTSTRSSGPGRNLRNANTGTTFLLQMSYAPKVLTSINLNGDQVNFSYVSPSPNRSSFLDCAGEGAYMFPRLLSGISIYAGGGADNRSWSVVTGNGSGNRPVLTSLTEYRDGAVYDRWSFTYVNKGGNSRYSQDWFGYNNGETGRNHLCPYEITYVYGGEIISQNYGTPNALYVDDGMMLTANHDGAVTAFSYEPSWVRYNNGADSTFVGVRVHSITTKNDTVSLKIRTFSYANAVSTLGVVPSLVIYSEVNAHNIGQDQYSWTHTMRDTPITEGANLQFTRVVCGKVTEEITGADLSEGMARTIHYYDISHVAPPYETTINHFPSQWSNAYTNITGNIIYVSQGYWDGTELDLGLETRREAYRWDGNNCQLVSVEESEYTHPTGTLVFRGYTVHQVMSHVNAVGGQLGYTDLYHYPVYAHRRANPSLTVRRLITVRAGGNDTTVIGYNGYIGGVTSPLRFTWVLVNDSDGFHEVLYSYPDSQAAGSISAAVDSLASRHILTEPIARRYLRRRWEPTGIIEFGTGAPVFVARTLYEIIDSTTYSLYPLQGGGVAPLPSRRKET
ncbi:MAG: hypothetical protein IKH11_00410, partial [Bacteroidales bacterium]|nr:hypothetical protein [Bacteroidales bacterium]